MKDRENGWFRSNVFSFPRADFSLAEGRKSFSRPRVELNEEARGMGVQPPPTCYSGKIRWKKRDNS